MSTIEIRGVQLLKEHEHLGNTVRVLIELADGTWREVITTRADDGPISHYVHPSGILAPPGYEWVGH